MRQHMIGWLITAGALVVLGGLLILLTACSVQFDPSLLSTDRFETNEHTVTEDFQSITIDTDTADVTFVLGDGEDCTVTCYETEKLKHTVTVEDSTLSIKIHDTRRWYEHIGIQMGSPKITVSIPKGTYGTLTVTSDTGDVTLPRELQFQSLDVAVSTGDVKCEAGVIGTTQISTSTGAVWLENTTMGALSVSTSTGNVTLSGVATEGDVKISVSTGKTRLTDLTCKNLISTGSTGDMILANVIASEAFSIERSTGDVRFDRCDAAELTVTTDTGDVSGSLLSEKIFSVDTDTGRRSVPDTHTGGRCRITTDTGDVTITIP